MATGEHDVGERPDPDASDSDSLDEPSESDSRVPGHSRYLRRRSRDEVCSRLRFQRWNEGDARSLTPQESVQTGFVFSR